MALTFPLPTELIFELSSPHEIIGIDSKHIQYDKFFGNQWCYQSKIINS
jgi:hypothetical protein